MPEVAGPLESEVVALRARLAEAQETLRAIRDGEVDALVMSDGSPGEQVFTLSSADRPYRLFVETMADGAATVSEHGVVLYVNQRLAEMTRLPVSQLVGAALVSLVPAQYRATLSAYDGSSDRRGGIEVELLRDERPPVWVRVGASALEVDGERMICLTFADQTQSRRHQSALASAHQKALQALRTRSQFVANMSHEIRTPLNGVIGMAGLMLTTELSDEQQEYADGVRASGDALMAVVDQILDFSKLDSGSLEIEDVPFSPLTVLEETCSMVSAGAQAKGVELLSRVDGHLPTLVSGDCTRLRQVLINLMGNAVKFTAAGYVCTTVSAVREAGGWRLRFAVQDTGVGVEPAATERIFNSFSQADGSTTRQYGGTGLGLAISRQLVGLMGGEIGVESGQDAGSTFWFTLLTGTVPEVPGAVSQLRLPAARVLLVDDSAMSRRVLEGEMAGWGLSCLALARAEDALALWRERERGGGWFDVVVLDSTMPGLGGIELAQSLRSFADTAGAGRGLAAPVVLLITDQRDRAAGKLAGVHLFVSKPVRQDRLYAALGEALQVPGTPVRTGPGGPLPGPTEAPREVLAADVAPPASAVAAAPPAPRLHPTPSPPARHAILLVEDNRINQLVAVRMLLKRGYEVDVAADGGMALDLYARRSYRAILMDCQMPVLDGYQATAEIRRREGGQRHLPILAMTANTMKGDREKCLAAGMDDYLGKPFTGDALDEALTRLFSAHRTSGEAGAAPEVGPAAATRTLILDASVLEELCGDDGELRQDLLTMFASHLEAAVAKIDDAVRSVDPQALLAEAHTLKGSSGSVGAGRVAWVSDALCQVARGGDLSRVDVLMVDLRAAAALTLEAVAPVSGGLPSRGPTAWASGAAAP